MPRTSPPLVIAVVHQKGGTGKTTTACNLAACFAAAGKGLRVAIVDLDPQGTATIHLGGANRSSAGAYEAIIGDKPLSSLAQPTAIENCSLVPATPRLVLCEMDAAIRDLSFKTVQRNLKDETSDFDLIIVDCPSGFGIIATTVMMIADLAVIPTPPLNFSEGALNKTIAHLGRLRRDSRKLIAVVLTMFDSRNRAQTVLAERIRTKWSDLVTPTVIPHEALIEEAAANNAVLVNYAPKAESTIAYWELTVSLGERLGLKLDIPIDEVEEVEPEPEPETVAEVEEEAYDEPQAIDEPEEVYDEPEAVAEVEEEEVYDEPEAVAEPEEAYDEPEAVAEEEAPPYEEDLLAGPDLDDGYDDDPGNYNPQEDAPKTGGGFFKKAAGVVVLGLVVGIGYHYLTRPPLPEPMETPPEAEMLPEDEMATEAEMATEIPDPSLSCDPFPRVSWWGELTHETVIRYVNSKNDGDWDAYIAKWESQREKLMAVLDSGDTVSDKSKEINLQGEGLRDHIAKVSQRILVTRCLAEKAKSALP